MEISSCLLRVWKSFQDLPMAWMVRYVDVCFVSGG